MQISLIIAFICLGIDVICLFICLSCVFLAWLNGIGGYKRKGPRDRAFKIFIDKSVLDSNFDSGDLDSRERGKDYKSIDNGKSIN